MALLALYGIPRVVPGHASALAARPLQVALKEATCLCVLSIHARRARSFLAQPLKVPQLFKKTYSVRFAGQDGISPAVSGTLFQACDVVVNLPRGRSHQDVVLLPKRKQLYDNGI